MSLAQLFYAKNQSKQASRPHPFSRLRCKTRARRRALLFEPLEPRLLLSAFVAHWVGESGNWSDPTHWDLNGGVPNNGGGNTYTAIIEQASADVVVDVTQPITISGLATSESIRVDSGGTLATSGPVMNTGILVAAGGTLKFDGAAVTNTGHAITSDGGTLQIANSTITGGAIQATGTGGSVSVLSGSTLDGVTLDADTTITNGSSLTVKDGLTLNSTLTLASSGSSTALTFDGTQTLAGTGQVLFAGTYGSYPLDQVYVRGGGSSATAATLTIGPGITLHGSQNGELRGFYSNYDTLVNQGTISADTAGKTITVSGTNWTNTGLLQAVNGGTLNLDGLDNTGQTLALDVAGGVLRLDNRGIKGGTVTEAHGGLITVTGGTLDGVTLDADTTITNNSSLTVKDGLTLNSTLTLTSSGSYTYLYFDGTQTLAGTGAVVFGGSGANVYDYLYARGNGGSTPATLTIGPDIEIHATRGGTVAGLYAGDTWTTTGLLKASGGATLTVDDLDNTGHTLVLDMPEGALSVQGTGIKGGRLTTQGDHPLTLSSGVLDGVTLEADVTVPNGQSLTVKNGLTLNSTLTLTSSSSYTYLYFDGTQTLAGTGAVVFGGTSSYHQLTVRGASSSNPATLTIGPGITLHGSQGGELRGYYANDTLINQGTIAADTAGKTLTVTGANWTNTGLLKTSNGGNLSLAGTFTQSGLGTFDATGGTVNIIGTLDNTGTTLALTEATGSLTLGGTIQGGTITATGGAQLIPAGGTLYGVTLEADVTVANGQTLTVRNGLSNKGALQSTSGATLRFVNATVANVGHTITADGGIVQIENSTLIGGTLLATDTPTSFVQFTGDVTLTGVSWADPGAGEFRVYRTTARLLGDQAIPAGQTLVVETGGRTQPDGASAQLSLPGGVFTNEGTIELRGGQTWGWGYPLWATLHLDSATTLAGSGRVLMRFGEGWQSTEPAQITGAPGTTLTLGPQQAIEGFGQVSVPVVNQGSVLANQSGRTLTLTAGLSNEGVLRTFGGANLALSGGLNNTGTVNLEGPGTLLLSGSVSTTTDLRATEGITLRFVNATVANVGHTITADGGIVQIENSTLIGGTLLATDTPTSFVQFTGDVTLTGVSWADPGAGEFRVYRTTARLLGDQAIPAGQTLVVETGGRTWPDGASAQLSLPGGVFTNEGTIELRGGQTWEWNYPLWATLHLDSDTTLAGSGRVLMRFGEGWQSTEPAQITGAPGTTLTLGPQQAIEGFGQVSVPVVNQGSVLANQSGRTLALTARLTNTGTMEASNGGTLRINGPFMVEDPGRIAGQASGLLAVGGSLLGDTRNADRYAPQGTTRLDGAGIPTSPQLLEVMGKDLGAVSAGFIRNFVYSTLALGNDTYVRLVDQSDNAAGTGAEALYVSSLVVPVGTTLDLNGLHLYTRAAQIGGTILGGTITQIPDSGPIGLGNPTPGAISVAGELDEWTFFGRVGRSVTAVVNPGGGNPPAPSSPELGYAQVQLLDAKNNVLAAGSSTGYGQVVALTDVPLPADGTYRIQVRASADHSANTGNYMVTLWDVTAEVNPLVLNQQRTGSIETPYSVDRWTFSAVAGQQVRFDLVNASGTGIVFDLTGPSGWTGFSDIPGDSDLITLPTSGGYTLTAHGTGAQYGGTYAFRLQETVQTDLPLGTTYNGTLAGNDQAQLFRITVPASNPLKVVLDDSASNNVNELYLKFGSPPTRGDYDYRFDKASASDQQILVPMAYSGTWYALVYGDTIRTPDAYNLTATTTDVSIASITPDHYAATADAQITITGAGFVNGTTVELVSSGGTAYGAGDVVIASFTQLAAMFAANSVPADTAHPYSLRVTTPGAVPATLPDCFTMKPAGEAHLETHLILPSAVGRHATATLYVEYSNTGDVAMPAPILVVDGKQDKAILTLDQFRLSSGFWASAMPAGFSDTVQFLASGSQPGLLEPGESVRVPIYYAGLLTPWDFSDTSVEFNVGILDPGTTIIVDWNSLKDSMRPDYVQPDAWDAIWANFTTAAGPTWGSYLATLDQNAQYLDRLGEGTNEITRLLGFELRQADALSPIRYLASATDTLVQTPGMDITFSRFFAEPISRRYEIGPLGRGWADNWQYSLSVATDGTATVTDPTGTPRIFQPDSRYAGQYLAAPGDYGQMTASGGSYILREQDGTAMAFRSDGKLDYTQDTNGNRITCGYTDNLLTSLTASTGQSLQIAYNAAGRITSLTDPDGRQTQFTYDAANEHLVSVREYDGRITQYSYVTGQGAAREHALSQITYPDGTHRYFTYDAEGRIVSTLLDNNAEPITFTYDSAGTVVATDALGDASSFFFDDWGTIVKTTNPLGNSVALTMDDVRNLIAVTDPTGHTSTFDYNSQGDLVRYVDMMGAATNFTYTTDFHQLQTLTDANGNTTSYSYDSHGNLAGITYANGSSEHWGYDALGQVTQWTDQRGRVVGVQWDSDGHLAQKSYADGNHVDYTYDTRGNLKSATDSTGTTTFTYDADDYLTRIDYPGGQWLAFTYDAGGRRASSTDQFGHELHYQYDAAGRLVGITDESSAQVVHYEYDAAGRLSRETLGNGVYTTYGYDAAGQLLHLVNRAPDGSVLSRFDYTYDSRGRRTAMAASYGTWTYAYDDMGQLTHAVLSSTDQSVPGQDLTYVYDPIGNRVYTIENGVRTDYTTNNLNQYTKVGDTTYTFDADGNLVSETSPTGTITYSYDDENRLIAVHKGTDSWTYKYDAFGQRTQTTHNGDVTNYVIDPIGLGNLVGEYNGSGTLIAHYDYGFGLLSRTSAAGNMGWYTFDALGSTSELTNAAGVITNSYVYAPFGEVLKQTGTVPNPFQFVGEWGVKSEGNGLDYMRARYYSPIPGRFASLDPEGKVGTIETLYAYARNDAVSWIDPRGLWSGTISLPGDLEITVGADKKGKCYLGLGWSKDTPGGYVSWEYPLDFARHDWGFGVTFGKAGGFSYDSSSPEQGCYENGDLMLGPGVSQGTPLGRGGPKLRIGVGLHAGASIGYLAALPGNCPWSKKPTTSPENMPTTPGDKGDGHVPQTVDPNALAGPSGFGPAGYITDNGTFGYRIDFENEASATAPAQQVVITDQLDSDLDSNSFALTEIGFGDQLVLVPANSRHFETTVPMTYKGVSFEVQIEAGLRADTGQVYASFYSIDPATGLPPNVLTGFLPPEDGTGRGMGHISYTVSPKAGLATGAEIRNVALISFDGQPQIATNQVDPHDPSKGTDPNKEALNTIDAGTPSSYVLSLPATTTQANLLVQWAGEDDTGGSGVASYDIYVSADGGAYTLWKDKTTDTSGTFTGLPNHTYAFYSMSTDHVGHEELAPSLPDASILVLPPNTAPVAVNDAYTADEDSVLTVAAPGVLGNDTDAERDPLTANLVTLPNHGNLTFNADGSFTYTPTMDFNGPDSFTYRASDGLLTSDPAAVTITITAVNDVPVFQWTQAVQVTLDTSTFAGSDGQVAWDLIDGDGVVDNSVILTNFLTDGTLGVATPTGGVSGTLPGGVTLSDEEFFNELLQPMTFGTSLAFTLHLTTNVAGAVPDSLSVVLLDSTGSSLITTDLLGDAVFAMDLGGALTVASATTPAVPIHVVGPAGPDQTVLEDAGPQTVQVMAARITAGPADEATQALTFQASSDNPGLFAVQPTVFGDGTLTYTPAPNAYGSAAVTVVLHDNGGTANGGVDTSAPQTFTLTIAPVNDAPAFELTQAVEVSLDTAALAGMSGQLAVDLIDGDGVADNSVILTNFLTDGTLGAATPTGGVSETLPGGVTLSDEEFFNELLQSITFGTSLTFTLHLTAEFAGGMPDSLSVVLLDSAGTSLVTTDLLGDAVFAMDLGGALAVASTASPAVAIHVTGPAGPDQTVLEDAGPQVVKAFAARITAGPDNEATQALTFLVGTDNAALFAVQPALTPDGTLTYTPAHNANGSARVTVRLQDAGGTANGGVDISVPQTFTITVAPVNDAPAFELTQAVEVTLNTTVLTDSDGQVAWDLIDGDGVVDNSVVLANFLTDGTLGAATPTGGVSGTLPGGVTLSDEEFFNELLQPMTFGTSLAFTLHGTTAFAGGIPDSLSLFFLTPDGTPLVTTDLLGDALLALDLGGALTKAGTTTPAVGVHGTGPVGPDQTVLEDAGPQTVEALAARLTAGPANEATQTLAFQVSNTTPGLFAVQPTLAPDGTLTYTPAPNANGSALVTVQLKDDGGTANGGVDTSAPQTFTIMVTPVNDAPVAKADAYTTNEDTSLSFTVSSLLANDTDVDATDVLTVPSIDTTGTIGKVTWASDGSFIYDPDGHFEYLAVGQSATDSFTYTVSDGQGGTDTATVLLTITGVNDAPVARPDTGQTPEDTPITIPASALLLNDTDVDGDALTLTGVANAVNGTVGLDQGGNPVFTPSLNFNGTASFEYTISDGNGGSATGTVAIAVAPVNDAPHGADKTVTTLEDTAYTFTPADFGFSDPNDSPANTFLAMKITTLPTAGTLAVTGGATLQAGDVVTLAGIAAGQLRFTPVANANGTAYAAFTFQVQDDGGSLNGGSDLDPAPRTLTVDVTSVNDAPVFTKGPDQQVAADAGPQTVAQWATAIAAGPANEAGQALTFQVSSDNPTLFSALPTVAGDGTLTYTPALSANGQATVTVRVHDDGGTANNGVDTSGPQTFTIAVTPVVQNVDSKVRVSYTGLVLNRTTNTFDTLATITNRSTDSVLLAPMSLVITSITSSSATLTNPTGYTAEGKPFVAVPLSEAALAPGESVARILLKFSNPTGVRFTFTTSVLAVDPVVSPVAGALATPQLAAAASSVPASQASDRASGFEAAGTLLLATSADGSEGTSRDGRRALSPTNLRPAGLIDWGGGINRSGRPGSGAASAPRFPAVKAWVRDFVAELGRADSRLGPNAGIRVAIQETVDLQPRNGNAKRWQPVESCKARK